MAPSPAATAPPDGLRALGRDPGLRAIATAYALAGIVLGTLGPAIAGLQHDLRLGGVATAIHGTFFGSGLTLLGLGPGRRLVRAAGPTRLLRLAVATTAAGALLLAVAPSMALSLPGAAGAGWGLALLVMAMPPVIRDHPAASPHAFADVNAVFSAAAIVGPLLVAGAQAVGASWRLGYGGAAVVAGVPALLLAWRAGLDGGADEAGPAAGLLRRPGFRLGVAVLVCGAATETAFSLWAAAFVEDVRDDAAAIATLVVGGYMAGQLVGRLSTRAVHRRVPAGALLPVLFATALAGSLLLVLGPTTGARLAAGLVVGLGTSLLYPGAMDRLFRLAPDASVAVGGLTALASGISIAVTPLLLGALADAVGLGLAIAVLPLAATAGLAASAVAGRRG